MSLIVYPNEQGILNTIDTAELVAPWIALQTGSDESVITESKCSKQKTGTHLCAPPSPQPTIAIDHCLKRLETSSCNEHTWAMRNISSKCIRSWHRCADCTKRFYFESGFEFEGKAALPKQDAQAPSLLFRLC